ncbi:hypothetical protein MAFF212519_07730 [Clavibacter michiganensis]
MITRHTNLSETRTPSRQELTFNECANDLFAMIADGDFPDLGRRPVPDAERLARPTAFCASTWTASRPSRAPTP